MTKFEPDVRIRKITYISKLYLLPFVSVLGLTLPLLWPCSTEECMDNRNSLPLAGFYASMPGHPKIAVDSISIYGLEAPQDSVLVDSATNIQSAYLPFRINDTSTSYVISYNASALNSPLLNDTVTFSYTLQPWFVSEACGAIYRYHVGGIDYTRHLIDSVACPTGIIDNKPTENLQIFFRVNSDE